VEEAPWLNGSEETRRTREAGTVGQPLAEINATIRRAEGGNKDALTECGGCWPGRAPRTSLGGNLAKEALDRLVTAYAGKNPVVREAVGRKLDELRAELSGANPTPVEKLLVERVVATWLHLHHLEMRYAGQDSMSLALGLYYQKSSRPPRSGTSRPSRAWRRCASSPCRPFR
jgi:hypothetical protein